MWLHAWACDAQPSRSRHRARGSDDERSSSATRPRRVYFMDMAETEMRRCFHDLFDNDDDAMREAAAGGAALQRQLPNDAVCDSRIVARRAAGTRTACRQTGSESSSSRERSAVRTAERRWQRSARSSRHSRRQRARREERGYAPEDGLPRRSRSPFRSSTRTGSSMQSWRRERSATSTCRFSISR